MNPCVRKRHLQSCADKLLPADLIEVACFGDVSHGSVIGLAGLCFLRRSIVNWNCH